jgi:hypothetical protein
MPTGTPSVRRKFDMKKNRQNIAVQRLRLGYRDLATVRGGAIVGGGREPNENGVIVVNDNGTIIIY